MKLLLPLLVAGLLHSCQSGPTDQAASPPINGEQAADALENQADAVRDSAEVMADRMMSVDVSGEEREKVLPDSLGPKPMTFDAVGTATIKQKAADGARLDTLLGGRCLRVWSSDPEVRCPYLLFRVSLQDTLWQRFYFEDAILYGGDNCMLEVSTFDWDGRPPREIRIDATSGQHGGGGGGSDYESVYIFSPGRAPRQLLKLKTADTDQMAGMGLEKVPLNERYTGCTRTVTVRGHEVVVGPIKTIGNFNRNDCPLTQLPAGRYRYQGGRVFRVGK